MTRPLAWLGRQGAWIVAALIFIGIALPPLGALLKPYLAEAVFVLLVIAFLQLDVTASKSHIRRPAAVVAGTAWTVVAVPMLFGIAALTIGLDRISPELFLALLLHGVASPMMSAPAFAALIGLDATLVLITLVTGTLMVPLTAPVIAWLFAGDALPLAPIALGTKLLTLLAGSALVAAGLRWLMGRARIERIRDELNGVNVLVLFVFVVAVMENVAENALRDPWTVVALLLFAFALFYLLLAVTYLVFIRSGRRTAFALAFVTSQRNLGLMLAASAAAMPDLVWLYVALSQFPIYLAPLLITPLARRFGATTGAGSHSPD